MRIDTISGNIRRLLGLALCPHASRDEEAAAVSMDLDGLNVGQIRQRAREEAAAVLRRHWHQSWIPVDPIAIARALGASVFSAQLGNDTWGMLIGSAGGADIYLDRDQPEVRFRFSCAHEIGHLVERGTDTGRAFVDRRSNAGRGSADEVFANEFAASLLMPEGAFRAESQTTPDLDLAARYEVSLDAVRWRKRHLRLSP